MFNITIGYSQLSDFNLSVTAINETCAGNGAINMSVSNTTGGSTIIYTLFLLPDSDNPIAETTTNAFNNLQAGSYSIVATQILGANENSQQQNVTINDLTTELDYEISQSAVANCDVTSTIIINVLIGNAVSYEIISGPVIVAPQDSNEFSNLPQGTYIIRVFDDCGNAISKTFTMFLATNDIQVYPPNHSPIHDSCTTMGIVNHIGSPSGTPISYPLIITYTITPPDGSPEEIITVNIPTESPDGFDISQVIPLYGDLPYSINISATDSCGSIFEIDSTIDPNPILELEPLNSSCGKYFDVKIRNFHPPYSINFTNSPIDFIPTDFNSNYPGPYNNESVTFQMPDNGIPYGTYTVEVTDFCGRTATTTLSIQEEPIEPSIIAENNGCDSLFGYVSINIPDRMVDSAFILTAPDTYTETLPNDISQFIVNGSINITNLPIGIYTFSIIDNCGNEYTIEIIIPEFILQELSLTTTKNCQSETGSLKIDDYNGDLTSITITNAPTAYSENLPSDVSSNITSLGFFFMNDLPIGNYTFEIVDTCGFFYETSVSIFSYSSTPYAYFVSRNCGSFDLTINDDDDTVVAKTYWFQKYFSDSNSWGHPYTGSNYNEGETPNNTNAIEIQNLETLYNIFATGDFRIIKVFQAYNSDTNANFCLDILAPFSVESELIISGIYNLDCENGSGGSDIILDVIGVEPYNFSITSPFFLDNGSNNTFTDLESGTYEVKVEDLCGSIKTATINLENLLPLVRVNDPENMLICSDNGNEFDTFTLTDQNSQILGSQDPNDYTITYHLSQADADSGNNPLPEFYTNTSNPQTVYARVVHNSINICYATTSFTLLVGITPILSPDETTFICLGDTITLSADSGFSDYEWSTDETTQSIIVSEAGIYSVIVKNNYENYSCDAVQEFIVTASDVAVIQDIEIEDWTATNNSISISVSGIGNYEYSIDNIHFQSSNTFTNLLPGIYTVYIKDLNGCGTITEEVFLLYYPNFFTPNDDGDNDYWYIKYSDSEPGIIIRIFDRYGKLLTLLNSNEARWDGTYNGYNMPTSDYWFTVSRTNGKVYKGHFTLKR